MNITASYFKDVSKYKLLTREQEVELYKKIEKGDSKAREIMINSNLRLAISIAKTFNRSGTSLNDLIQESNMGLLRAIERFDWRKGFKFSTYASWWIRQSVSKFANGESSTIKVPTHASSLGWKYSKLATEYSDQFDHDITDQEAADILGVSIKTLKSSVRAYKLQNCISLDRPLKSDESSTKTFGDLIPSKIPSVEDKIQLDQIRKIVISSIKSLTEKEEKIIRLRFGIYEDALNDNNLEVKQ